MSEDRSFIIEFPKEGCASISQRETVLDAALSAGIPLFHVCGGRAMCSTCRILVIEGEEFLTPRNASEKLLNDQMHFPPNVRLACQTSVTGGPVKLRRIIQDETDISLYVGNSIGPSSQQIGEQRELVLFFLDIRDFTPFIASNLAFDVIHIIRKLFNIFQNIIESNNGKIIETAGDGIYAVFGCEANRIKSIQSAVQSGLSILADVEALNKTYFNKYFSENIQLGIGVHVGKVISGTIRVGTEDRMVVMGYPVNIASRLQNATKELNNSFVVSSEVYEYLLHPMEDAESLEIKVKGIAHTIPVFLIGKRYR